MLKDDEAFLTENPRTIVEQGRAHRIPMLLLATKHEGQLSTWAFLGNPGILETFEQNFSACVQAAFHIPPEELDETVKKLKGFYLPGKLSNQKSGPSEAQPSNVYSREEKIEKYTDMLSDGYFMDGLGHFARNQRQLSPVYLIYYDHPGGPTFTHYMTFLFQYWDYPHPIRVLAVVVKQLFSHFIMGLGKKSDGTPNQEVN